MTSRTLLVTAAFVFMVGGAARAAELSTAPMFTSGTHFFYCSIVNVSSVPQTVRIRIYDVNGNVSNDTDNFVLPARATQTLGEFGAGHCRFTTANAKTLFRASISVSDGATPSRRFQRSEGRPEDSRCNHSDRCGNPHHA